MSEHGRSQGPVPGRRPRQGLLVLACIVGVGLGPLIAAGAAVGGSWPPVLAAACMIGLSVTGAAGLVISVFRWVVGARWPEAVPTGSADEAAARFASTGQRTSFALALAVLLILVTTTPLVLVLHLTGPQEGPGKDVGAILVAAMALVATSALVVPTIAAQFAWTWRSMPSRAEAAVLAGVVPGPRRLIITARAIAVIAWTLSLTGGVIASVLLFNEAKTRLHAIATSYSARDAADAVRSALLDQYVVGDIRCPDSLPDPGTHIVFSCRVTSLGRTAAVEAEWYPSGFGRGDVTVPDADRPRLTRIADLPGSAPSAVALQEDITATALTAAVREQLIEEGWTPTSRAVQQLSCPSVSRDVGSDAEASFVRCTIGQNPETQRYLDVYPIAGDRFAARTIEIADLPH